MVVWTSPKTSPWGSLVRRSLAIRIGCRLFRANNCTPELTKANTQRETATFLPPDKFNGLNHEGVESSGISGASMSGVQSFAPSCFTEGAVVDIVRDPELPGLATEGVLIRTLYYALRKPILQKTLVQ